MQGNKFADSKTIKNTLEILKTTTSTEWKNIKKETSI